MNGNPVKRPRCAIYTRKSSEEGLEQEFNSLDAQREACEAFIKSQAGEGWRRIQTHYDDGGVSGATMKRPALEALLADIEAGRVDTVVVYKVDRLTRALADFAKMVEIFDAHGVSFVSVTQQFNTTTSMGRLTLNMLLSFAQFEREVTGERIRDKVAASKKKGMWMGGFVPLGYEAKDRTLVINKPEAETVRTIFRLYLEHGNVRRVMDEADRLGLTTKIRQTRNGRMAGGRPLSRGHIYRILQNPLYVGRIGHKGQTYEGQHPAIIDTATWDTVQTNLADNAHDRRSGARAAEPSLLAGLIHDDRGNRLSPSHAVKDGRRYRYYVSQAVLQNRKEDAGAVMRVPAREIEGLVEGRVRTFLKNPGEVIDAIGDPENPRDQHRIMVAARKLADRWPGTATSRRRSFLLQVISGITIGEDSIEIRLRRIALRNVLLGKTPSAGMAATARDHGDDTDHDHDLILSVPARLKPCSGEMRLVIPPGHSNDLRPRPNTPLIRALARAHDWKQKLFSGEARSIRAIARSEGMSDSYVGYILRLAFLAPDITEAILDGRQPADLELNTLMRSIPHSWPDQRRLYRFGNSA